MLPAYNRGCVFSGFFEVFKTGIFKKVWRLSRRSEWRRRPLPVIRRAHGPLPVGYRTKFAPVLFGFFLTRLASGLHISQGECCLKFPKLIAFSILFGSPCRSESKWRTWWVCYEKYRPMASGCVLCSREVTRQRSWLASSTVWTWGQTCRAKSPVVQGSVCPPSLSREFKCWACSIYACGQPPAHCRHFAIVLPQAFRHICPSSLDNGCLQQRRTRVCGTDSLLFFCGTVGTLRAKTIRSFGKKQLLCRVEDLCLVRLARPISRRQRHSLPLVWRLGEVSNFGSLGWLDTQVEHCQIKH